MDMSQVMRLEEAGMKITYRNDRSFLQGVVPVGNQNARLVIRAVPDSEPGFGRKNTPRFDTFIATFSGNSWRLPNLSPESVQSAINEAVKIDQAKIRLAQTQAQEAVQKTLTFKQEFELNVAGYKVSQRDPSVKPEAHGSFMVTNDADKQDDFALVGDDCTELIKEAHEHVIDKDSTAERPRG